MDSNADSNADLIGETGAMFVLWFVIMTTMLLKTTKDEERESQHAT